MILQKNKTYSEAAKRAAWQLGWNVTRKGGAGSGHKMHRGIPGYRGGSAPSGMSDLFLAQSAEQLSTYGATPEDAQAYWDVMMLDSDDAKAMLERAGMTREEVWAAMEEARTAQMNEPSSRSKNQVDGVYTEERQALHDDIVTRAMEGKPSVPEGEQPTILLTGGFPGSGKSSMLEHPEYKDRLGKFVHVDNDAFKGELAKADGHDNIGWRAQAYHGEGESVAGRVFRQATNERKNILYDGTMKSASKLNKLVDRFKAEGYRVEIAFADLPLHKAMERAIGRFLGRPGEERGRFVDPAYVTTHDARNIGTLQSLKDKADEWKQWNTDIPYGELATLKDQG